MSIRDITWVVDQAGEGLAVGNHLQVTDQGIFVEEWGDFWWKGAVLQVDPNKGALNEEETPRYLLTDDQTSPGGTLTCDRFLEGTGVVWTAQEGTN